MVVVESGQLLVRERHGGAEDLAERRAPGLAQAAEPGHGGVDRGGADPAGHDEVDELIAQPPQHALAEPALIGVDVELEEAVDDDEQEKDAAQCHEQQHGNAVAGQGKVVGTVEETAFGQRLGCDRATLSRGGAREVVL